MVVRLGNERLFDDALGLIAGRRVGLVTNPTGVDSCLRPTADRLHAEPATELAALFGPEHGIRGDAEDGVAVGDEVDRRTGVPAISLYGSNRELQGSMLEGIDVLLFDVQDVGARFYTYLYTMSEAMKACAVCGVPFVLLDRPNPVGGELMEGNILDPAFSSYVGRYPIPVRYGLTIGEVATLFNEAHGIGAELEVVELRGWKRSMSWEETGLPWVAPSPNMPTPQTAALYPGTCFFEGTNLSEGRGTTRPFELIGAPFVDGFALADAMNDLAIPGAQWRPVFYTPSFGKHAGERCGGVQLHAVSSRLRPVTAAFHLLATAKILFRKHFEWNIPARGIHNFDKLAGSDRVRLELDEGTPVTDLLAAWEQERRPFAQMRERFLRY